MIRLDSLRDEPRRSRSSSGLGPRSRGWTLERTNLHEKYARRGRSDFLSSCRIRSFASRAHQSARKVRLPLLLVGADSSPPQFSAILDRLQPCLRHAERALITHSSHGMSSINPVEFNAAVMAFIARH